MSKVSINTSTLTAIGDAIREKTGKTDLITPGNMPQEIRGIETGGGGEVEPIVLTGSLQYVCTGPIIGSYFEKFGDTITTQDVTGLPQSFMKNTVSKIPFEINMKSGTAASLKATFQNCVNLTELPKINNAKPKAMDNMCYNCERLREIPEDYFDDWDWTTMATGGSASSDGYCNSMFYQCYSLRKLPVWFFKHMPTNKKYSYSYFYSGFSGCYVLDELVNLPIPYTTTAWTNNFLSDTFSSCHRLKNITFETNDDGTPIAVQWGKQTLDLASTEIGYVDATYLDLLTYYYNSGITTDKRVKDAITYQALKNDPDWFATAVEYSRYNHDSAVNTINSLPSTSGSGCVIKFKGAAGSATDGGAINTLTEEEIAVAAAKGWTVTLV